MGTIRLGKRTDSTRADQGFVPLADLNDIVFTGWDIFEDNVYEAAAHARCWMKDAGATEAVSRNDQAAAGGFRSVLREAP